jgi:hypothetical protein
MSGRSSDCCHKPKLALLGGRCPGLQGVRGELSNAKGVAATEPSSSGACELESVTDLAHAAPGWHLCFFLKFAVPLSML